MIYVTRLNGQKYVLNCDLIKTMESTPDTVITLTQGDKVMVREEIDTLIGMIVQFRRRLYQGLFSKDGDSNLSGTENQ